MADRAPFGAFAASAAAIDGSTGLDRSALAINVHLGCIYAVYRWGISVSRTDIAVGLCDLSTRCVALVWDTPTHRGGWYEWAGGGLDWLSGLALNGVRRDCTPRVGDVNRSALL